MRLWSFLRKNGWSHTFLESRKANKNIVGTYCTGLGYYMYKGDEGQLFIYCVMVLIRTRVALNNDAIVTVDKFYRTCLKQHNLHINIISLCRIFQFCKKFFTIKFPIDENPESYAVATVRRPQRSFKDKK